MKNKMANKLLAILLSAAMAVTVLPQTSAFATEAGESEIAVEEIEVTDLSEQTGEDSADVEGETEEDAEIEAEKTESVPGDSRETAIEVKEDEKKTVRLIEYIDDEVGFAEGCFLYLKVIPQKTGVYEISFDGNEEYIDCCIVHSFPENKFIALAGQPVYIDFFDEDGKEPQDFNITVTCTEEWGKADGITVGKEETKITLVMNKIYPITFKEYGNYNLTATSGSYTIYRLSSSGLFDTYYTGRTSVSLNQGDTYYFYSKEGAEASIVGSDVGSLQVGENVTEYETIYSFTAPEAGTYAFCGFKKINSEINDYTKGFVTSLSKDEILYVKGCPYSYGDLGTDTYETKSYICKVQDTVTALGNVTLEGTKWKQLCYQNTSDKNITLFLSEGFDSVNVDGIIGLYNASTGWSVDTISYKNIITCQPGEKLYIFIQNNADTDSTVCVRKLVEDNENNLTEKSATFSQTDSAAVKYGNLSAINALDKEMELKVNNSTDYTRYILGAVNPDGIIEWGISRSITNNTIRLNDQYDYIAIYEDIIGSGSSSYSISVSEVAYQTLDLGKQNEVARNGNYQIKLNLGADSAWYRLKVESGFVSLEGEDAVWIISSEDKPELYYCWRDTEEAIYLEKGKTYIFNWYLENNGIISFTQLDTAENTYSKFKEEISVSLTQDRNTVFLFFTPKEDAFVELYKVSDSIKDATIQIYEKNDYYFRNPVQIMQSGKEYLIKVNKYTTTDLTGSFQLTNNTVELSKIQTFQNEVAKIGSADQVTLESRTAIESARAAYDKLSTAAKKAVVKEQEILQVAEEKYAKLVAEKAEADKVAEEVAKKAAEEAAKKAAAEEAKKAAEEAAKKAAAEAAKKEAVGAENVVGDATYVVAENQTVIYKAPVKKDVTSVKIPETIKINDKDFTVTEIAAGAFKNNKKLTKVTISKNIKVIGKNAFYGCSALKSVTIGSKVTTIGDGAFQGCSKLTKVTIPAKVTKIGKKVFYNCKKLKTITIKTSSLKSVGKSAFKKIAKKASIKVPKKKLTAYKKLLKGKTEADTKIKK